MRIAFITYEYPPDTSKGGIGTYTSQIAAMLVKIGWDVHVFAGSHYRQEFQILNKVNIHWILCTGPHDFRCNVLHAFANEHFIKPFDLIESPEIHGNAWEIKKKFPFVPLVVRLHAPNYLVESLKKRYVSFGSKFRYFAGALRRFKWDLGFWRTYEKEKDPDFQYIQLADYITAPSAAMKNWVVQHWKITPSKITIIPNVFSPANELLQLPVVKEAVHKSIVFFGRLNVLKGLVNATRAMKKILTEYPEWQFKLIGDEGYGPRSGISMSSWIKQELNAVIDRVAFSDGITYEAIPQAIANAEIVLLPSLFESFSYTCAEAMAAGKAVIGSKNGGMADLLKHNESGMLVNPEDDNAIYLAIKNCIDDNEFRQRISHNARERILTVFDANEVTFKFSQFYNSLISQ